MFGGFHSYDLIIIFAIALLFFGARRLPEMGSAVGKTIREFQKSMRDIGEPHDAATTTPAVPPPTQSQQIAGPAPTAKMEPAQPTAEAVTGEPIQQ